MISLRGIYNAVESRATPVVEDVVHSAGFGDVAKTVMALRRRAGGAIEGITAGVLHAVNLPAGTDMRKLRRQLGELDYEVRRLRIEVAEKAANEETEGSSGGTDS